MQAGRLDRRVTIEKPATASQTGSGQKTLSHTEVDVVWAAVEDVNGRERFVDDQVAAEADTLFVMRYRSDLTPEYRLQFDGRAYDVKAATELRSWLGVMVGRRRLLGVFATTRAE